MATAGVAAPVGAQPPQTDELVAAPTAGQSDWEGLVGDGAPITPATASSVSQPIDGDARRLHVKMHEGSDLPVAVLERAGATAAPLFGAAPGVLEAQRATAEQRSGEPQPDLTAWFLVQTTDAATGAALADELRELEAVEMVQPEPTLSSTQADEEVRQGYLDPAPTGVGAEVAWGRSGGTGANVTVAVIDSGFDTTHSDLDRASAPGVAIAHEDPWDAHHGLQVLGILAADNDSQGLRGIAYGSGLRTINSGRSSGEVANAINLATAALSPGDVITISQGICAVNGCGGAGVVLPLVYSASARDALRLATANGIITVVSGGNGGADLNGYSSRLGFDAPETIVVGAGNPPPVSDCTMEDGPARGRVSTSNYGSRIDLQGWGACVRTAEVGGGYRWWGFTSAATPIVAGAAALVSSMARAQGTTLTGGQVRALLEGTGSAQVTSGTRGGNIGPLPDAAAALAALDSLPANDQWVDATAIGALPQTLTADPRWAGVQLDEPAMGCATVGHTLWYRYQPDVAVDITIETTGSDYDTALALWRSSGSSLARIACSDDITENNPDSRIRATLEAGETYYIQVGGVDGDAGRLRLSADITNAVGLGCDIDDDGRGDIVSGSPGEDIRSFDDAGRGLVHHGRVDKRPGRPESISQEWPGATGASERNDRLGAAVACGDFDGDGYDDVALGSPGEGLSGAANAGAVRIVDGGSGGVTSGALTLTEDTAGVNGGAESGDRFGSALAAGDFDGDGYADLAIGAKGEDKGGKRNTGVVHIIPGSASGLDARGSTRFSGGSRGLPNKAEAGDRFGAVLATGDLNGDGYDDLAIGAPAEEIRGKDDAGAVFVLLGGPSGLTTDGSAVLHQARPGVAGSPQAGDRFGAALATGDITGDGRAELVVGAPGEGIAGAADAGAVYVFTGTSDGVAPGRSTKIQQGRDGVRGQPEPGDLFGTALAVGDLTGDGFADLAVGAPGETVGGVDGAGVVHVFDGSDAGALTSGDQYLSQNSDDIGGAAESGDAFGAALTTADLDGDRRRDLVVGIPGEDLAGKTDVGSMLVLPGGADGVVRADSQGLHQRAPRVGGNETGDRFGEVLAH